MKYSILAAAIILGSASTADAWQRISTEDQFRAQIVGRTQVIEDTGHITSHPDGRVVGEWQGNNLRGRWEWHDGYWCRNLIIGTRETGTNCLLVERQGDQLRATQDRGRGNQIISTLR